MNQYGQRIKEFREKMGLSQVQFAGMLGVDPSHICRIEKGKGTCSISLLQKAAVVLGVPVAVLLDEPMAKASGE